MNWLIGRRSSLMSSGATAARRGLLSRHVFGQGLPGGARGAAQPVRGVSVVRLTQSDGPHCFAVMRVVPGPSCVDILQAMQHKPELMFEELKRWAKEESAAREGGVVDAGAVATALARAFHSMPYLVVVGEAGGDEMSFDSEGSTGVDYE